MYFCHQFPFPITYDSSPQAGLAVGTVLTDLKTESGNRESFVDEDNWVLIPFLPLIESVTLGKNQSNFMNRSFLILKTEIIIPTLLFITRIRNNLYNVYVCGRG